MVWGAGRKAKRMVLQCINGVGSNPVEHVLVLNIAEIMDIK